MKLDFLPELIKVNISNPELNKIVIQAQELFNEKLNINQKSSYNISYGEIEDIYSTSKELQKIMKEFTLVLKGSSVKDCIEVSKVLSNDLLYFRNILTDAPVWDIIEEQLDFNLHILSFQEKVKAAYGLSFKFPKKCTFGLRQRLVTNLLKTNFDGISLQDMMLFFTSVRNEAANDFCHYKFYDNFLKRMNEVISSPLDSSLPVDSLYCFFNNKLKPGKRKNLRFPDEEIEEELNVLELLAPVIRERISSLSISSLFRLLSALSIARIKGYTDLLYGVLSAFKKNMRKMDKDVFIAFLTMISNYNNEAGTGDKQLWDSIQEYIEEDIEQFLELPELQYQFELLRVLSIHKRMPLEFYFKHFDLKVKAYLSHEDREWSCLYKITQALTCLNLTYPEDPRTNLKDLLMSLLFSQKYWSYRQHYFFKMFQNLMTLRHSNWDLTALNTFAYHAEKEFDIWRLKKSSMTPELKQILSITQNQLEMKLIPLLDFKQSFLIDLGNPDLKFGVMLRTHANTLSSQRDPWDFTSTSSDFTFYKELQIEILKADSWHIFELDFQEFLDQKDNKVDWLSQKLKSEFATAMDKRPDPYVELRNEVDEYINYKAFEDFHNDVFYYDKFKREAIQEAYRIQLENMDLDKEIDPEDFYE